MQTILDTKDLLNEAGREAHFQLTVEIGHIQELLNLHEEAVGFLNRGTDYQLHWTSTPSAAARKVEAPFVLRNYWGMSRLPKEYFEEVLRLHPNIVCPGLEYDLKHWDRKPSDAVVWQYERRISMLEKLLGIESKSKVVVAGMAKEKDKDTDALYAAWQIFPSSRDSAYLVASRRAIEGYPCPEKVWLVEGDVNDFLKVKPGMRERLQEGSDRNQMMLASTSPLEHPIPLKDLGRLYVEAFRHGLIWPKIYNIR